MKYQKKQVFSMDFKFELRSNEEISQKLNKASII